MFSVGTQGWPLNFKRVHITHTTVGFFMQVGLRLRPTVQLLDFHCSSRTFWHLKIQFWLSFTQQLAWKQNRYSWSDSTKSPGSGSAPVSEPRLVSHVGRVREDQCVDTVRVVEVPGLVCLRSSSYHVTEVGGPCGLWDSALKLVT
jgi:hypothetical protein